MNAKHTPGPWQAGKNNLAVNDRFVTDADGNVVAFCDLDMDTARVNARLIAAAPELLDACDKALSCLSPEDDDALARALRSAIAKAEGRQ